MLTNQTGHEDLFFLVGQVEKEELNVWQETELQLCVLHIRNREGSFFDKNREKILV